MDTEGRYIIRNRYRFSLAEALIERSSYDDDDALQNAGVTQGDTSGIRCSLFRDGVTQE